MSKQSPEPGQRSQLESSARSPRTDFVVFGVTAVITVFFVGWGVLSTETLAAAADAGLAWLVTNGGWAFVLAATGFVIFAVWLAFSRYGSVPLGKDGEAPGFHTVPWIAVMSSAGRGVGHMVLGLRGPPAHCVAP